MREKVKNLWILFFLVAVFALILGEIVNHSFNPKIFSADNVYKSTEELSSGKYSGRQAGTDGNIQALKYVEEYFKDIGLSPAGENGTYYQNFKTLMPVYNKVPEFSVRDKDNKVIKSFKYGKDFREDLNGYGGTGNINEKLYIFNGNIKNVSKTILKEFAVVSMNAMKDSELKYAADEGCKAVIFPEDTSSQTPFDMKSKSANSMLIYKVSGSTLDFLKSHVNDQMSVNMDVDVSFKMLNTPNVLGKIEGKSKSAEYVFISSHIDGVGKVSDNSFVQGSLHDASGTAMVMEIARTLKLQKSKPEKTIVFAVWNGFEEGITGSKYYVQNPLFPLDKSEIVVLDYIGSKASKQINFSTYGNVGEALMGKLRSYFPNNGNNGLATKNIDKNDTEPFIMKDVPSVLVCGSINLIEGSTEQAPIGTVGESMDSIGKDTLNYTGGALVKYFQGEVYNNWFSGLLSKNETAVFCIFILAAVLMYLLKLIYKLMPTSELWGIKLENINYSVAFGIIDRIIQLFIIVAAASFLILFIMYIPKGLDVALYNKEYIANYSVYAILEKATAYVRELLLHGFGKTQTNFSILYIMSFSIIRSIGLILCSITLAFLLGILFGTISGFLGRRNSGMKYLGSIAVLSLPDVFIAILFQLLTVFLYQHKLLLFIIGVDERSKFIIPFICLAVIPTAYISRIAQIAVGEEMSKEYVIAAKAKGLSNFSILKNHILISAVMKVVDSLPSVLNMIISNLIIVEYFFAYPGIVYQLFNYFKDGDIKACIGFIIGLGIVYCILIIIFNIISLIVNPTKKRRTDKSTAV